MCYGMGCEWEDSYGECHYPRRNFLKEDGCVCVGDEKLDEEEDGEEETGEDEE